MNTSNRTEPLYVKLAHPFVAGAALSLVLAACSPSQNAQVQPTPHTGPVATAPVTGKKYADGTYTAVGTYASPAEQDNINVTLTLGNGLITDAKVENAAVNPISKKLQDMFIAGFKEQVIGKPIDGLSLTAVNGASLSSKGFIDAVTKIEQQATAS